MLVIRLARTGRNKYPTYRIVSAESARAATGKFIAILGHYNPHTKELVLKKDEIERLIKNGAQPSNTVVKLLQKEKVTLPAWVQLKTRNKASKQDPVEETTPAEAPAEDVSAEEAAADADTIEPEVAAEAEPATVTAEAETEKVEAAAPADVTPTAETEKAEAEAAEKASDTAAEVATESAE